MTDADETSVLRALSARIKKAGWFPARDGSDGFMTRSNRRTLDGLVRARDVSHRMMGGVLSLSPQGLRRLRDKDDFAREELVRAVEMLERLQTLLEEGRPEPHTVFDLQQQLGWAEPNDARRALYLLWLWLGGSGITPTHDAGTETPEGVTVSQYIWDAEPEALLNGPPAVAEHSPTNDDEPPPDTEERTQEMSNNRVFIGHGASLVWRELKDFLQDRLGLHWDEFNRESTAGLATKERLEAMLQTSGFAFLVMTPEDEHADGSKHARASVIHEVGLFQGRLGFRRAIVLLQEDCEEFSNIVGLTQIRFPKGKLSAAFEDVRRVLEREGLLPSSAAPTVGLGGVPPPARDEPGPSATPPLMYGGRQVPGFEQPMDDDEAQALLETWLGDVAESVQAGRAKTPQIREPAEIASQARVPISKVLLLVGVASANAHFGVTVTPLQSGKIRLDVGNARVREV